MKSKTSPKNVSTIDSVVHCLNATMAIDLDELEQLVEQAHECDIQQIEDPNEVFPISRQALRMFWYFRRNIDAVQIHTEQS
ncbi:MAG: hypothetical protein GWP14_05965 [Actinobacteria bacterium]|nr:hypothetical protein [Actinomycetota bacterium]